MRAAERPLWKGRLPTRTDAAAGVSWATGTCRSARQALAISTSPVSRMRKRASKRPSHKNHRARTQRSRGSSAGSPTPASAPEPTARPACASLPPRLTASSGPCPTHWRMLQVKSVSVPVLSLTGHRTRDVALLWELEAHQHQHPDKGTPFCQFRFCFPQRER